MSLRRYTTEITPAWTSIPYRQEYHFSKVLHAAETGWPQPCEPPWLEWSLPCWPYCGVHDDRLLHLLAFLWQHWRKSLLLFWLRKNACSVFLFILLFHMNSHFLSSFCGALNLVQFHLSFHFSLFHLFLSFFSHSSFCNQSIMMHIHSFLFSILNSTLQSHKMEKTLAFYWCSFTFPETYIIFNVLLIG